jgi:hypothetical protein
MKQIQGDIEAVAGAILHNLPVHLQRPAWQVQVGDGASGASGASKPCVGKDCPCTGTNCPDTIIGHDPLLLVVVALVIGIGIGIAIGSRMKGGAKSAS